MKHFNAVFLLVFVAFAMCFSACKKKGQAPDPSTFAIAEEHIAVDSTFAAVEGKYAFAAEIDALSLQLRRASTTDDVRSFEIQLNGKQFNVVLTELMPNTTYDYWYVADYADDLTITTATNQFTTLGGNGGGGEEPPADPVLPTVQTLSLVYIGSDMAVIKSEVVADGGAEVMARGLCWSLSETPTLADLHTLDSCGVGSFESEIADLSTATIYHVCAYATNAVGTAYGEVLQFTTLSDLPVVHTLEIVEVGETTALVKGEVIDGGGISVTERGLCWSLQEEPSDDDALLVCGSGLGEFAGTITDLQPETDYYVRAYARSANGIGYGKVMALTTMAAPVAPLKVVTVAVNDVSFSSATCVGEVVSDGGVPVTERGICWDTQSHPNIEGNHIDNGSGLGVFDVDLTCLRGNTMYFVRAYAVNAEGVAYGNTMILNTSGIMPTGAAKGLFSVDDCRQVCFSKGNLQYIGSANPPYWKFADQQYEILASFTGQNSDSPDVDRDLFGWATSGFDHGAVCYQPWSTADPASEYYYAYGAPEYNLFDQTGLADWGANAIQNGGNVGGQWRTLTKDECYYLLHERVTPSGVRYAKASLQGTLGLVLVPDEWSNSTYTFVDANNPEAYYNSNQFTREEWTRVLEPNGAVFLPAAGFRGGIYLNAGDYGYYWTSSAENENFSFCLGFCQTEVAYDFSRYPRSRGFSVRLARDVE